VHKTAHFAAQSSVFFLFKNFLEQNIRQVEINIKGIGPGREAAIRAIQTFSFEIVVIRDLTSIPHNGCRARKKRRV
jgi:small subunit ribosomal protein S11